MDRKRISLLGSTGSIGRQTLEAAELLGFGVGALAGNTASPLLEAQARKYKPAIVAVFNEDAARDMKTRLSDTAVRVVSGMDGLTEAATLPDAGTVVTAVVGTVGLKPTLAAIQAGKRIALANKETLVCAGEHVMRAAKACHAEILPVDSEHSAIFQCLEGNAERQLQKIILTASGGPFRGRSYADLEKVTRQDALCHPNWKMGPKITVDSATLMNKGLEFIEAMHLYGVQPEQIEVVVHPQSIIHSAVAFCDNSILAQLSVPDMRLPIQFALTYPERQPSLTAALDLTRVGTLTFEAPDLDTFRCLQLAMETASIRGTACAVMNAANEAAVSLFLEDQIKFTDIYSAVQYALDTIKNIPDATVEDILDADKEARACVCRWAGK